MPSDVTGGLAGPVRVGGFLRFDAFGAIVRAVTRAMAGSKRSRGVRPRPQPTALFPGACQVGLP